MERVMVIYGEYLFLENFIVGLILLTLTGRLTGKTPVKLRLAAAAAICGAEAFLIFVPIDWPLSAIVRICAAAVCAAVAFGRKKIVITGTLFLVLTFLSGGIVMAVTLWKEQPAVTHQGTIYMDAVTYSWLMCAAAVAFGITYWFVRLIRKRGSDMAVRGQVCLVIEGKSYYFSAFVDSGNSLREPLSGSPVILIDERGAGRLPFRAKDLPSRYRVIPYRAVGTDKGSLEGIRTDRVVFEGISVENACVAFYRGDFRDFEVLLNRDFLERGLFS